MNDAPSLRSSADGSWPRYAPGEAVQRRIEGLAEWLNDNAPLCAVEQKHLEEHTPERAYWHYGYLVALHDVLRLIQRDDPLEPGDIEWLARLEHAFGRRWSHRRARIRRLVAALTPRVAGPAEQPEERKDGAS